MKSLYGAKREITEAQYLAELICKKCAEAQKVYLPARFWTLDDYKYWTKKYKVEIVKANRLLKQYSFKAIILALNDGRSKKTQSLLNKYFDGIVSEKQRELNVIEEFNKNKKDIDINTDINSIPTQFMVKRNKLSKLRD